MKFRVKEQTRFAIYVATDLEDTVLSPTQIERCQYWTLAHEIGHILLHGHFLLNSIHEECELDETTKGILEVEAHWFASRLLMPDYMLNSRWDLDPKRFAEKCQVNLTPAEKRIEGLNPAQRKELARLEPAELIEKRRQALKEVEELRFRMNLAKNEEILDRLRRVYGYE
ncbi:ImmA/IrrE family metallo-endopeptidase [Gorillibacterium sp. sgz5001074]|uniref:ImmA/IrrE family metallo-endopeptidase n=1 Tax=Gorillibacterium sp. sgz5001074 TaxID=3446695 RepID=UPI003F673A58